MYLSLIGVRSGLDDNVRAVSCMSYGTIAQKLLDYYTDRPSVIQLVCGGDISWLGPGARSTDYFSRSPSKFYATASEMIENNKLVDTFYVIDIDDTWYFCNGEPSLWFKLEGV